MELSVIQYSILLECSRFLSESRTIPLYKALTNNHNREDKVKIRLKSKDEGYYTHLDNNLNFKNFKNRSLTTYTNIEYINPSYNLYYVFVPDRFKCIYTKDNIHINFKEVFKTFQSNIENAGKSFEDFLKISFGYNLEDAIDTNDEIMFYDIPYYYCIRADRPYCEVLDFYDNI